MYILYNSQCPGHFTWDDLKNSFDLSTLKSNEILALGQQYIRDEVRCSGSVKSITHNWTVSCGEILPTFAVDECFFI